MSTRDRGIFQAAVAKRADDLRWAEQERRRRAARAEATAETGRVDVRSAGLRQSLRRRLAGVAGA